MIPIGALHTHPCEEHRSLSGVELNSLRRFIDVRR
jgi:hypothetical protein